MLVEVFLVVVFFQQGVWCDDCRDRFRWPFSQTSIWNTPVGSDAKYIAANLYNLTAMGERACVLRENDPGDRRQCGSPGISPKDCINLNCCYSEAAQSCFYPAGLPPLQFHNDQDFVVLSTTSDPLTPWVNQGSWSTNKHCEIVGKVQAHIPFPRDWTSASDGGRSPPGQSNNNAMGVLLPDNRTLVQMQPAYRCAAGTPLLARWGADRGCPQMFPNTTDILGDGALGAHGGSGLSAVGGTIRVGELLPEHGPIRHALKLELFAHDYYYGLKPLNPSTPSNGGRTQYRWPATGSDSYTWDSSSGLRYNGSLPAMCPGALLAIPPWIAPSVVTTTVPGSKMKQALVDYGGYLVDDTAGDSAAVCMEAAVNEEMRQVFNLSMAYPHGVSSGPLYNDLVAIFRALHVVDNNVQGNTGGGGQPRMPLAPPICGT